MKKILMIAVLAVVASTVVFAQSAPLTWDELKDQEKGVLQQRDKFNAFRPMSTEARYSGFTFDGDIDNYIDARYYKDVEIQNGFVFLGGFPQEDTREVTEEVTDLSNYALSLGAGFNLNDNYLALYYGGHIVDASGGFPQNASDKDKNDSNSTATWENNLALLFGTGNMGFRFDLIMNSSDSSQSSAKDPEASQTSWTDGATIALTWGMAMESGLYPYVTLGFQFAESFQTGTNDGKTATVTTGGMFALMGGVDYWFNDDNSKFGANLTVAIGLPDSGSGDKDLLGSDPYTAGGGFGVGLDFNFMQQIEAGPLTARFSPNLGLGITSLNPNFHSEYDGDAFPTHDYFTLSLGLDIGLKFQINDQFALFTGAGLTLLEWNTFATLGGEGDNKNSDSSWRVDGISWNADTLTADATLGLGLVFTPVDNISVGFGLNTITDKIFKLDLVKMKATTELGTSGANNFLGEAFDFFGGLEFDLTVSVKF